MVNLSSSKKQSLVDTVYDYLLDLILSQKVKSGERIPEKTIAEQLNISRTPIREAIRMLANVGLIKIYPNRFAEVISFSEQDMKDIGYVRIMLDSASAKLAILNGSNADFSRLKKIADACYEKAKEGKHEESIQLDGEFHMELTRIARNPILTDMQERLYLKVQLIINIHQSSEEERIPCIEQHYDLLDKLVKRDSEGVSREVYNHLAGFYHIEGSIKENYFEEEVFSFMS